MGTLVVALVVAATGIGGVDLATAHNKAPARSAKSAQQSPDPVKLLPPDIRIETSRWTQLAPGGSKQLVVHYHLAASHRLLAMVLAWDRSAHSWVPVYNGTSTTSDVLVPTGSTVEAQFAQELIDAVDSRATGQYNIPDSSANVALIETWMAHEGGLWANNPLNTSLDAGAYPHEITSSGEDTGIPIYPNLQVGVANTASTLLGNPAYAPILSALANGSGSCMAFASAVVGSPWAASHYGWDPGSFCPAGSAPELLSSLPSSPPSEVVAQAPASHAKHHAHKGKTKHPGSGHKQIPVVSQGAPGARVAPATSPGKGVSRKSRHTSVRSAHSLPVVRSHIHATPGTRQR